MSLVVSRVHLIIAPRFNARRELRRVIKSRPWFDEEYNVIVAIKPPRKKRTLQTPKE